MGFHLAPQTATGRTSPIDQMCDHQLSRLLGCQLRHGQHCLQQLSHVGRRERRQDLDFQLADPLFVLMEGHCDGGFVVGNSRKDRLRASVLQQFSLNFSHFVARTIWRRRGISPRRGKAHRLQRRGSLRCVLVPMATPFDLLQTARN
jgi:hypothetical protein